MSNLRPRPLGELVERTEFVNPVLNASIELRVARVGVRAGAFNESLARDGFQPDVRIFFVCHWTSCPVDDGHSLMIRSVSVVHQIACTHEKKASAQPSLTLTKGRLRTLTH